MMMNVTDHKRNNKAARVGGEYEDGGFDGGEDFHTMTNDTTVTRKLGGAAGQDLRIHHDDEEQQYQQEH